MTSTPCSNTISQGECHALSRNSYNIQSNARMTSFIVQPASTRCSMFMRVGDRKISKMVRTNITSRYATSCTKSSSVAGAVERRFSISEGQTIFIYGAI